MMSHQQQQQNRKFYPCRKGCGTQVTFDNRFKNPDGTKFVPLVQDALGQLSPHDCSKIITTTIKKQSQPQQHQQKQQPVSNDLFKEVAAIKAQLLVLVSRLDRIEQELQK
jgi:hypothetical protein